MKSHRPGQVDGANAAIEAQAAENRVEAHRLRLRGHTYREIADALDVSVSTVHNYVMAVRDELNAAAHELAALVRDEEDAVLLGCKRRLLARLEALDENQGTEPDGAKAKKAADGALINLAEALRKNGESRRALWGADAPPAILAEVEAHAMTFLQAAGSESDLERIAAGGVSALQVLAASAGAVAARLKAAPGYRHEHLDALMTSARRKLDDMPESDDWRAGAEMILEDLGRILYGDPERSDGADQGDG